MKKLKLITGISIFFVFFSMIKTVNGQLSGQYWDPQGNDIINNNPGDVLINNSLRWSSERSYLSPDQGGSIELGYDGHPLHTPYIDFHSSLFGNEDFNARIINNLDLQLEFQTRSGSGPKMTFNGTPSGPYSLPTLRLTNPDGMGNSFEFQDINGISAIDFWHDGTNAILNFFADYQVFPPYNQFSVKRDNSFGNTCGWGNDESWLCGDRAYLGAPNQGASIHLNQAGTNLNAQPYIGFAYAKTGNNDHNDVVLKNSGTNQLDFFINTNKFGENGTRIMTIKNEGVFATKLTVQTSWMDFVFNKDYKLMPLCELEAYIKENKHLPDIPSEQEVSENGVELGSIVSKLTQKAEEQTLYIIELNKAIKELKEQIEGLKNKK